MNQYEVIEVKYGSEQYEQTLLLRDKVMRQPLGCPLKMKIYPMNNKLLL